MSIVVVKVFNGLANSVDPDEIARYELSLLDLHCLQKYSYLSAGLKQLTSKDDSKICLCSQ